MYTERFDTNNYEFNDNEKIGIYLIHGFSSSTYEVKLLAQHLESKGFHVIANNLPGHGTNIEDCNRSSCNDWLNFSKQELAKLISQSTHIYVIGCSMGAVIGLYLASIFPINGLIIGGTVIKFKKWFGVNYLNPIFCKLLKTSNKSSNYSKTTLTKIKFYGYSKYPLIALNEFKKLIKLMEPQYALITCPTLIFHSKNDNLSTYENANLIYKKINSKSKNLIILERAPHSLFDVNPDADKIYKDVTDFIGEN